MKRQHVVDAVMFVFLVASGVTLRLVCQDIPNFAPVAALALFAGYMFRSAFIAALVPLTIMPITDWFIGGYDTRVMAVVYGMLALPVCFRGVMRSTFKIDDESAGAASRSVVGLAVCGIATSLLFFLITNFAVWIFFDYYETSLAGLGKCYLRALPFFKYTLASDAFFGFAFFGGYAFVRRTGMQPVPQLACGDAR